MNILDALERHCIAERPHGRRDIDNEDDPRSFTNLYLELNDKVEGLYTDILKRIKERDVRVVVSGKPLQ